MGTNKFFVFDENRANLLSDQEYQNSDYRKGGAVAGIAPSNVHNKMYLQSSTMAAAIAQVIADAGKDVSDSDLNLLVSQIKESLGGYNSGWRREHPYSVGDISTPSAIGSYKYLECTVGGQSGTTEPTWGDVGSTVTDGGVTWVVRDRRVATARFDNSAKIATSNFVKAAGLRFSAMGSIIATSTLNNTYAGKLLQLYSSSAFTVTLPSASIVPSGETIAFVNRNSGIATVASAGTDALAMGTSNLATIAIKNGETLTLVSNGADAWFVAGSTAHLGKIDGFGSSLAANGYQKLPSGLIIQWGGTPTISANSSANITYPITFPSGMFAFVCTAGSTVSSSPPVAGFNAGGTGNTRAGCTVWNSSATTPCQGGMYVALGY